MGWFSKAWSGIKNLAEKAYKGSTKVVKKGFGVMGKVYGTAGKVVGGLGIPVVSNVMKKYGDYSMTGLIGRGLNTPKPATMGNGGLEQINSLATYNAQLGGLAQPLVGYNTSMERSAYTQATQGTSVPSSSKKSNTGMLLAGAGILASVLM